MNDRTVHARTSDGTEIVRYARSGKWYLEADGERFHVGVNDAVRSAAQTGTYVYFGEPGGKVFESRLLKLVLARYGRTVPA